MIYLNVSRLSSFRQLTPGRVLSNSLGVASRKTGRLVYKHDLSPILTIFRLMPEPGSQFPPSRAGQYIALRRDDAPATKAVGVGPDGKRIFALDVDAAGRPKTAPITHSYSIASAPWEQARYGYLEFYVVLMMSREGVSGRLSSMLLRMRPDDDCTLTYIDRIVGSFTLEERAAGFDHVIMVGTGTGLSPFVAMTKELHGRAVTGGDDGRTYTLLHTNRVYDELAYHARLLEIEREAAFDFTYMATVSRPTPQDRDNGGLGVGRANNVLRHLFDLPSTEEDAVARARPDGGDVARAEADLARSVRPTLPSHVSAPAFRERIDPSKTIILTCGNPASMADIQRTAARVGVAFEKEEW